MEKGDTVNISTIQIKDIRPYEKNARNNKNSVEKVTQSIKEFGFKVPIVLDKNNVIVCGHTRYEAAKKLKMAAVPCVIADDLTENQIKAYRLADNKVAEFATWDFDILKDELFAIDDIDMSDFGFDLEFGDDEEQEVQEDDYITEIPKEPKSKRGDIYQLGRHRLMCGDSTNIADVEKLVDGKKVDMLLTDPPYNVDYEGKTKEKLKIENDKMSNDNFRQFLIDAFRNANSVMRDGAVFYIWHADSEGYNFRGACFDVGWKVRQCIIWNKNSMVMGRQDYQWKHEPCLYGWKDGASHNWENDRKQTTVIDMQKPNRNDIHPTMKPIQLFDYQIKNNTKKGDVVLDLFGGSGTTIMACEQNGRVGYSMEYDARYIDAIIDRWEQFTGEKAILINDKEREVK